MQDWGVLFVNNGEVLYFALLDVCWVVGWEGKGKREEVIGLVQVDYFVRGYLLFFGISIIFWISHCAKQLFLTL